MNIIRNYQRKPISRFVILFMLFSKMLSAQVSDANDHAPKNDVKLGYGVASIPEVVFSVFDVIGTVIGTDIGLAVGDVVTMVVGGQPKHLTVTSIDHKSRTTGTFQLGYNRMLKKRLALGVQANYTHMVFGNVVHLSDGSQIKYADDKINFAQLYGRLDFNYVLKPRFQMYSGVMAGGFYVFEDSSLSWAGHLNLLGFRFGRKHAFYTEFGLGFSSTITAGYSQRF